MTASASLRVSNPSAGVSVRQIDRLVSLLPIAGLAVLVIAAIQPLKDPDLWWHLKTGMSILQDHRLLTSDPWGYMSTQPWMLHEWGSEVVIALAFHAGGLRGIMLLRVLALAAIGLVLVRECRMQSGPLATAFVLALAPAALSPFMGTRPQLASFALMAWFAGALRRRIAERRVAWHFVLIFWLWGSIHGLWAVALMLFAATLVGVSLEEWSESRGLVVKWWSVWLASVTVLAITPLGPRLLVVPFTLSGSAKFVSEWAPPSLLTPYALATLVMVAIVVVGMARQARSLPWHEITFVLASTALGFTYTRTLPVAFVTLAPVAARELQRGFDRWRPTSRLPVTERAIPLWRGGALVLMSLLGVLATLRFMSTPTLIRTNPRDALAVLSSYPEGTRVLNSYGLGGWELWWAPNTSPAIDGRIELYTNNYVARYDAAFRMQGDWRQLVSSTHADAAWISNGTPLITGLSDILGWRVVFNDGQTTILLPPGSSL